jgi:DNA-binding transcriptional ArsR family regulator
MSPRSEPAPAKPGADLASIFFALGDETRLRLVAGGAFSIAQLTTTTAISRQAVTKHLQVMAQARLVRDVKVGRERLWQLDPVQIEDARRSLELIGRQWDQALGRLKLSLEGGGPLAPDRPD